jgi:hypothetical protein
MLGVGARDGESCHIRASATFREHDRKGLGCMITEVRVRLTTAHFREEAKRRSGFKITET